MSNIKVVCKNLNGHPIEFIRKMNELSEEIKVSWSIEGGASNKKYRIDIFWEDTSLNEKVEEVIDSFSSYFVTPEIIEINIGGYEEKQPSNVEEKRRERKRRKDYEVKPVEAEANEIESEVDCKIAESESEIFEEEPSKIEITEPIETEIDYEIAESESEIFEEEPSKIEITEPIETEIDYEIAESEGEIYEEEPSKIEITEPIETEIDYEIAESEGEIYEQDSSEIEITEPHEISNSNETNEVGESHHSENANEPQQVICEKADTEESKKAFLDLISSKLPEDTTEKLSLEVLCSDLSIGSEVIKKGIKHSCNRQVKNLNDLFKQVATELRKNPKVIEFTMKADLKKWVESYPDDTPKKFTLSVQEFLNVFRKGLKKL